MLTSPCLIWIKPTWSWCQIFLFIYLNYFKWRIIALQRWLFSAKYQHESATAIHMSPLSHLLPIPPLYVFRELLFELPESLSKFPLALYFTYGNVSFQVTLSVYLTLSFLLSPLRLFSMSVSPDLFNTCLCLFLQIFLIRVEVGLQVF